MTTLESLVLTDWTARAVLWELLSQNTTYTGHPLASCRVSGFQETDIAVLLILATVTFFGGTVGTG